jgi:hypothetical protein
MRPICALPVNPWKHIVIGTLTFNSRKMFCAAP